MASSKSVVSQLADESQGTRSKEQPVGSQSTAQVLEVQLKEIDWDNCEHVEQERGWRAHHADAAQVPPPDGARSHLDSAFVVVTAAKGDEDVDEAYGIAAKADCPETIYRTIGRKEGDAERHSEGIEGKRGEYRDAPQASEARVGVEYAARGCCPVL